MTHQPYYKYFIYTPSFSHCHRFKSLQLGRARHHILFYPCTSVNHQLFLFSNMLGLFPLFLSSDSFSKIIT